jgi:hypothetical protein
MFFVSSLLAVKTNFTLEEVQVKNPIRTTACAEDNPAWVIATLSEADWLFVPKLEQLVFFDSLVSWKLVKHLLAGFLAFAVTDVKGQVRSWMVDLQLVVYPLPNFDLEC